MMNCFEVRQEFAAFWRRELAPEQRSALVAHLKGCAKCDHAFRTFAMSAPVLHSAAEPPQRAAAERPVAKDSRARRPATVARGDYEPRRRGYAMSAAAMILVAASLAAYFSVTAPVGSLTDELSGTQEPAVQLFGSDLTPTSEDLAS